MTTIAVAVAVAAGAGYWFARMQHGAGPAALAGEGGLAAAPASAAVAAAAPTADGERQILYYRNPMGLPDTSPVPKKDSMGMDYIPVYADDRPDDGRQPDDRQEPPERFPVRAAFSMLSCSLVFLSGGCGISRSTPRALESSGRASRVTESSQNPPGASRRENARSLDKNSNRRTASSSENAGKLEHPASASTPTDVMPPSSARWGANCDSIGPSQPR